MATTQISEVPQFRDSGPATDIMNAVYDSLPSFLEGSVVKDYASLAAAAEDITATVTITGAALGDFVIPSFSLDLAGLQLTAYVSATNTVTFNLANPTAGAVDLASGTLRALIVKKGIGSPSGKSFSKT